MLVRGLPFSPLEPRDDRWQQDEDRAWTGPWCREMRWREEPDTEPGEHSHKPSELQPGVLDKSITNTTVIKLEPVVMLLRLWCASCPDLTHFPLPWPNTHLIFHLVPPDQQRPTPMLWPQLRPRCEGTDLWTKPAETYHETRRSQISQNHVQRNKTKVWAVTWREIITMSHSSCQKSSMDTTPVTVVRRTAKTPICGK